MGRVGSGYFLKSTNHLKMVMLSYCGLSQDLTPVTDSINIFSE